MGWRMRVKCLFFFQLRERTENMFFVGLGKRELCRNVCREGLGFRTVGIRTDPPIKNPKKVYCPEGTASKKEYLKILKNVS